MRLGLFALPAAFVAIFAVLIAGCGGGGSDPLTLEEYFAQFEAIDADVDAQFEAAFEEVFADFPDEEDIFADEANLPLLKEVSRAFPRITSDSLDRLKELDPPSEVEDAHNDMVAALADLLVAFEEGIEVFDEAETMAEFETLNDELQPDIDAAQTLVADACFAVVAIGVDNGIANNISCGQDE